MEIEKRVICLKGKLYMGEAFAKYSKKKHFHKAIVDELAAERDWIYDFDFKEQEGAVDDLNECETLEEVRKTVYYHDVIWGYNEKIDERNSVLIRFYAPRHPKDHQRADAVVFHWIESVCIVYVFPVYYPPDDYIEPELYSFMSEKCYSRGNKVTYSYSMFYDDNYDIQDCSTIEISSGFVLDTEKLRLYYDDPYGYEEQADQ